MWRRYTAASYRNIAFGKYTQVRQPSSGRIRGSSSPSWLIYSRCHSGNRICNKKTSFTCINSGSKRIIKNTKHGDLQTAGKETGQGKHSHTWTRNLCNGKYATLTSRTSSDGVTGTRAHLPRKRRISCATQTTKRIKTKSGHESGFLGSGPKSQHSFGCSVRGVYSLGITC